MAAPPCFTISAADKLAPDMVRTYANAYRYWSLLAGITPDDAALNARLAAIRSRADEIAAWQAEHRDLVKVGG